jgi:probable phosphoglycerate mutase
MPEIQTRWGPLLPLPISGLTQVVLIRHGQTTANADGIIQGWIDYPLTRLGCRQADDTGRALKGSGIGRVFASPLGRAMATGRILADALDLADVTPLPGMIEVHAGAVTGRTWAEFAEVHPQAWQAFQAAKAIRLAPLAKETLPGWEPVAHVAYRTWNALGAVLAQGHRSGVVIVSHGDTIDCLLSQILDGTGVDGDWHYRQPNCGVSRLVLRDGRLTLPDGVQVLHQQSVT